MLVWRNEQQAQQQLQQDEEQEEHQRWNQDRELLQKQLRLEEITNHTSRQDIEGYQAQIIINANTSTHSPSPPPSPSRSPSPPPPPQPQVHQHNPPVPRALLPYHKPLQRHSLGLMNFQCSHCHALHFFSEKLASSSINQPKFGMCCLTGQIDLPALPPAPRELADLFNGTSPHSLQFKTNIHQYNATFAFTSLGVKVDQSVTASSEPYSFRISGELHHLSGALLPLAGNQPVFAQIYIYDPAEQLAKRQGNNTNLNPAIMAVIQGVIHESHPYVELYRRACEVMMEKNPEEQTTVAMRLHVERSQDLRRYNLPTTVDEVAVIIPGDGSEECSDHHDIILRLRHGGLQRISHLNPAYSTLQYPILFPQGEDGWHKDIPLCMDPGRRRQSANVTQCCYYAYRLHPRPGLQPPLLWGGNC